MQRRCQKKGGNRTGEGATKTGLRSGATGANREMGNRSRAARQQEQGSAVKDGGSGRFSRLTGGPRPEKGG